MVSRAPSSFLSISLFFVLHFLFIIPQVTAQSSGPGLTGTSGQNCIDTALTGVRTFYCAQQGNCNVDLCQSANQNWLYDNLLGVCETYWPNVNVAGYTSSQCGPNVTVLPPTASATIISSSTPASKPTTSHKSAASRLIAHSPSPTTLLAAILPAAVILFSGVSLAFSPLF